MTKIEWTGEVWNPTRGCSRVSEGCRHCYAELMQARFDGKPGFGEGFASRTKAGPRWTGKVELDRAALGKPERWKKPRMIFVNSMSDLWHESLPEHTIAEVYGIMEFCDQHTFQVLTKRADRRQACLQEWTSRHSWPILRHIWEGTSVENRKAPSLDWRAPRRLPGTEGHRRIVSVRDELLGYITPGDVALEGFPGKSTGWFIAMYCSGMISVTRSKKPWRNLEVPVNRIEFEGLT